MTSIPTQVTFRGLAHSDQIESEVREHVAWIQQFHTRILRCRVLLELPHRQRRHGRHFHVRVELTVPGRDPIVISHEPSLHGHLRHVEEGTHRKDSDIDTLHRHATVALREAFETARRRLDDVAQVQRGAARARKVAILAEPSQA